MNDAFRELRTRIESLFALASRGGDYITATQFNAILEVAFPPELPVKKLSEQEEFTGQEFFPATLPVETVSVTEPFYAAPVQKLVPDASTEVTKISDFPTIKLDHTKVEVRIYRSGGAGTSGWYIGHFLVDHAVAKLVKDMKFSQSFNKKLGVWNPIQLASSPTSTYSIAYALYGADYYGARRKNRSAWGDVHDYTSKNFKLASTIK